MPNKPKTKSQQNKRINKSKNSPKASNKAQKDAFNFDEEIVIGMKTKVVNTSQNKKTVPPRKGQVNKNVKQSSKTVNKNKTNKKKKSKKKVNTKFIKAVFQILCLIGVIVGTIIFLMISPVFNVKSIEVINNKKLNKDTYISLSGIKYNENIYRINKKEVIEKIKSESAYVQDVKIKRNLPDKITIEIQERTATYMIEIDDAYMYIDNQGYMLEKTREKLDTPTLIGISTKKEEIKIGNRLYEDDLQKLNKVLEISRAASTVEISNLITKVDVSDVSNYKLVLENEKKTVHLGDATDLVNKFKWVKTMVENEKGKKGDIYADRDLNSQPVYFSPSKDKVKGSKVNE